MPELDFPYGFDGRGRTAETGRDEHVRDLIEQVLFTAPGDRVNRPDFGSGLLQLVFEPNSEALVLATRTGVQAALQRWLGELVRIEDVQARAVDAALEVTVCYVQLPDGERRVQRFRSGGQG